MPRISRDLTASEVAQYGRADWNNVEGRGGKNIFDYSYELGKLMCDEFAHTMVFEQGDEILVGKEWNVENGRHRALTLRTLGDQFVKHIRMDNLGKGRA